MACGFLIQFLLITLVILPISALLFVLIEKPFMFLSRAIGGRRRAQRSPSGNPTISAKDLQQVSAGVAGAGAVAINAQTSEASKLK